ncbi:MAG: ABC transporter ATP-binding protein, partial [Candidatus Sulfotelmatobacter sp.]
GYDIRRDADKIKRRVGYMTQRFSLYQDLSVRENLEFVARLYGMPDPPAAARNMIGRLGLGGREKQLAGELSGGWKQRLALGACTLSNPQLLLLDEPTAGVDPKARRDFWNEIHALAAEGLTVLVSTHYMDEAERLCDRLAIVDHGQIIAEGSPPDLIERLGGHHVVEFAVGARLAENSDGAALEAWRALPSVESVREDDGMVALSVKEPHLTIPALLEAVGKQGSALQHLTTRQASLEDVFVRLTGRHLREE